EDIPELIDRILRDLVARHSLPHIPHLENEAVEELTANQWRGNIRELRNTLEQLSVMAFSPQKGQAHGVITAEDVRSIASTHLEAELGYRNLALTPITAQQAPPSELGLIYRALLELRNDISEIKQRLQMTHLPLALSSGEYPLSPTNGELNLRHLEEEMIHQALRRFEGDRKIAAEALGISERSLYRKLKEFEEEKK
ncbi:MAG: helix-turn-helix domain-containing protein, partial [Ignavibacteriota bacterium]